MRVQRVAADVVRGGRRREGQRGRAQGAAGADARQDGRRARLPQR